MQAFSIEVHFLLRWLHIMFGAVWLGLLFLQAFVLTDWIRTKPHPELSSLRRLLVTLLGAMTVIAGLAYTFGFTLMSDLSHIVGRKMFTISWGLFILTAGYLGTQLLILTWGFIVFPVRKELFLVTSTAELVQRFGWRRAEVASQWAVVAAIPFLFLMVAANHWVINLDKTKLWVIFGIFAAVSSTPLFAGIFIQRILPRWALLLLGFALLGVLLGAASWARPGL